jgi:peptide deformylase
VVIDQLVFNTNPWQIRTWPADPSLRLVANEITEFDDPKDKAADRELRDLVIRMGTAMNAMGGLGLAAPQVGVKRRLIVLKDDSPKTRPPNARPEKNMSCWAMCNPRILDQSEEVEEDDEGCLSLPGMRVAIWRSVAVIVESETTWGETLRVEAVGVEARVLQHEIDHLNGKLIVDYLEDPGDRRDAVTRLAMMAQQSRVEEAAQMREMAENLQAALGSNE